MPESRGALIRVVWGTASGKTAVSSYDTALAEAGVHNYNLIPVSSVIPAGTTVEQVGSAPDLGPIGNKLYVIQSRATTKNGRATAGLGWTRIEDGGVFYESNGEIAPEDARSRITTGLTEARNIREWPAGSNEVKVVCTRDSDGYATAVVLGVYGRSHPLL